MSLIIYDGTKNMAAKPQYHTCAREGCNAKCSKEFCRNHNKKLNNCGWEGCTKKCRKEFCHHHKPESMRHATEYQRQLYFTKKAARIT